MTLELVVVAMSYLLGSIPTALLVVWATTGADVRAAGSGNVGATNAGRAAGLRVGVVVTVLDAGKGAVAVLAMTVVDPASRWLGAAALAAVVGHCFPVWLKFRGGKGVATAFGAFAVLAPLAALCALVVWVAVVAVWRMVSLASMLAAAAFPPLLVAVDRPHLHLVIAATAIAVLVVVRHVPNIRKIIAGQERRVGGGGE